MKKVLILSILFLSLLSLGIELNSSEAMFMAPQREAMNPEITINGTNYTDINCDIPLNPNGNFTFEVDYTDTRSTERYNMQSIPYAPELDFDDTANLGTQVTFSGPDMFAPSINFFPFSFFDETTSSLAIGENGLISLDPAQGDLLNLRYPSANIPNSSLTRNSIFASHYDLMINGVAGAGVYYKVIGSFPARKLVITYKDAGVFYCVDADYRTTSVQVVLEELTNRIQIHIKEKTSACGAITNAVVGIQDKYGNLGYSPNNRNYTDGDWTANNESWEFIPNGDRVPQISWIEGTYVQNSPDNNIIGSQETITVNTDLDNLEYTVEVRYPNYTNELGEIVDLVLTDIIEVSPSYPIGVNQSVIICTSSVNLTDYNTYVSFNPANNFTVTYYYDQALTSPISNPTNFSFTGEEITIYAKIEYNSDCYDTAELHVSSILGSLIIDPNDLEVYTCDNVYSQNGEGSENNYMLSNLDNLVFQQIANGDIFYYSSSTSNIPITQLNITDGTQIWVDVVVNGNNGCRTPKIGPITIHFNDVPEFLNVPTNLELVICDKNWDYREDFDENQTWQSFLADNGLITNNPSHIVSVYETETDAIDSVNELTQVTMDVNDPTYNPDNNSRDAELFIRIEDENGCFSIKQINTRIRFYGIDAKNTPIFNLCIDTSTNIPIDLSCFLTNADFNNDGNFNQGMFNEIFFENGTTSDNINDVYDISYHSNYTDANTGNNPISINQNITAADAGIKTFYIRFTLCESCTADRDDCYTVKKIRFRVVSTQPQTNIVEVCQETNGSTYVPNLNIFNLQLFENPNLYTISYYETQTNAQNQTNEITSYSFSGNENLWVHITSNLRFSNNSCIQNVIEPCEGIYNINFVLGDVIEPINFEPQTINNICDNNDDGEEFFDITIFESDIYAGDGTFTYFENMDETTLALSGEIRDPTQVLFTATNGVGTKTIFARLTYTDNPCNQIIRITITLNFLPGIETQNGFLCACLPNPGEYATFDLTQAVDQIFLDSNEQNNNQLSEMVVSYYNFFNDAINGEREILSPQNYESTRGVEEIFVRFFSTESQCYSVNTLTLKNLVLPVPIPNTKELCDTNINGYYDIILNDLDNLVMPNNTNGYYFSYYWNYEDAENGENPIIQTPDSDNPADFFYEFTSFPTEVYVRVDADNGECPESAVTSGSICNGVNVVTFSTGNEISTNNTIYDLPPVCDTFNETGEINNPTYNDGIASGIDLTSLRNDILNDVNDNNMTLLYYSSLEDLENDPYPYGNNIIDSPENFTNVDDYGNPIEQVYVKLTTGNNTACPIYVTLNIHIDKGPEVFPEEVYYICPNGSVDIRLQFPQENPNPELYTYLWTLPDGSTITDQHELIGANQIGIYSVKVTDNTTSCESPTMNFVVQEIEPPTILDLIVHNESEIEVIATGFQGLSIEYSIDGVNFQQDHHFYNLTPGVYTVWVRYRYNNQMCLGAPKDTILLNIYNVVTPNGDGLNDCFSIEELSVFGDKESTLIVYDRYGKVIYTNKSNTRLDWCGNYNGRVLPTSNYWYKFIIPDGREKSGYISLKNY